MKYSVVSEFFIVVLLTVKAQKPEYLCSEAFCEEQRTQNPCEELPKECSETSTAKHGITMLDPSLCNCCDFCLVYLEEGADCVADGKGDILYKSICGPGLGCNADTGTCVPLDTACMRNQREWDESRLNGSWGFTQVRPMCDDRGLFYPVQCIGASICYCVNPEGERIFGEAVYSSPSIQETMDCECSRAAWKAQQLAEEMGIYSEPVHCLEDGSYDPLQCNDKMCRCLTADTHIPDISIPAVLDINIMDNYPTCFDSKIHAKGKYKRKCEEELEEMLLEIKSLEASGITAFGYKLPDCQYDGRYSRVMTQHNKKLCVDPEGKVLENYIVLSNSSLYIGMDCNCARTRRLMNREGISELPICYDNGNFREMQCRRGKCYCVDCNGVQLGVEIDEVNKEQLNCRDNSNSCGISPVKSIGKTSEFVLKWNPPKDFEELPDE